MIVSSHLMSEIQEVADQVVIMGQGKLLADMTMEEMNKNSLSSYVYVEAEDLDNMKKSLEKKQAMIKQRGIGLEVRNLKAEEIGRLARDQQLVLHELKSVKPSLDPRGIINGNYCWKSR